MIKSKRIERTRTAKNTSRPIRLWDAKAKEHLPHRCYSSIENAHVGAMKEVRWGKELGKTIEVYNAATGKLLGQYTNWVKGIYINRELDE